MTTYSYRTQNRLSVNLTEEKLPYLSKYNVAISMKIGSIKLHETL